MFQAYAFTKYPWWHARPNRMARDRRLILALAALSPRYLSGVIGRMSIPIGVDEERLWRYRSEADVLEPLQLAGVDPADLRKQAESLLLHTQDDPMHRWLKVLRYAR